MKVTGSTISKVLFRDVLIGTVVNFGGSGYFMRVNYHISKYNAVNLGTGQISDVNPVEECTLVHRIEMSSN